MKKKFTIFGYEITIRKIRYYHIISRETGTVIGFCTDSQLAGHSHNPNLKNAEITRKRYLQKDTVIQYSWMEDFTEKYGSQ